MIEKNKKIELNPAPFLRWAGGKRWFIRYLDSIKEFKINNYYEPFLGGGSVFFHLQNFKSSYLSDLNQELVETYVSIRDDVEEVIKRLHTFKNTEGQYYQIRATKFDNPHDNAAKFIFLNMTSYNGIYRVNKQGKYNVPYGFRKYEIDDNYVQNLRAASKKLFSTNICFQDFYDIEKTIEKGDFVFLDPPYTVAHENNGFIQYNQKIFSLDDQIRLSNLIRVIKEKGAFYILTNAKHQAILDIYSEIEKPRVLTRSSTVGGKGARREGFKEYIFSNCLY